LALLLWTADNPPITITLAWTAPSFAVVKGIIYQPDAKPAMKPESRDALLIAIAFKARGWIDDIRLGRFASFAEIAAGSTLRTAHPFIGTTRLSVTTRHCSDRRCYSAGGSDGLAKALIA
jgi:hypothetical protein